MRLIFTRAPLRKVPVKLTAESEIHLEREGAGGLRAWIPLDEWCEVVRLTDGVRLAADQEPARNSRTGKAISFGEIAGESEVYFPAENAWRRVFRWDPAGYISFSAPADFSDPRTRLRVVASSLAERLRAEVLDEHGQAYA